MIASLKQVFFQITAQANLILGHPVAAVMLIREPDGSTRAEASARDMTSAEVEFAAKALLDVLVRGMEKPGGHNQACPCCTDRLARLKALLPQLSPGAVDVAKHGLH